MLMIESAVRGLLYINGQFCGPLEQEGQAFPVGGNGEVFVQLFPFGEGERILTAQMHLQEGVIKRLEPKENCFALCWPGSVVQLELRMHGEERTQPCEAQKTQPDALMRYLHLRLAGDSRAALLRAGQQDADGPDLSAYHAAVPLRFPPETMAKRYDQCAGLVRRVAENAAYVDVALANILLDAQGRSLIGRIEIVRT